MIPEVGKTYFTSVASGRDYTRVTVTEVWEQANMTWVKVDGQFTSGSETGITLNADMLLTDEEFKAKMAPKKFVAKFPGKCFRCKSAIKVGDEATWHYPANVRVQRNPVVHVTCPAKEGN